MESRSFRNLVIRKDFTGKEHLMQQAVEHARAEDAGEVLFVHFGTLGRENTHELSTAVVFEHCLIDDVSKLETTCLSNCFIQVTKLLGVCINYSINDMVQIGVCGVIVHEYLLSSGWWDLNVAY